MDLESLIKRADSLKAEIDALRPINAAQEHRVWQKFALDWNYHSNAIEGNQVTLGETEMFLQWGLTGKGKPFKDYLDIRGHNNAIEVLKDIVQRKEAISEALIRELHKTLLSNSDPVDAETPEGVPIRKKITPGEYKTVPNHVKTPGGGVHYYVDPLDTPAEMAKLVDWWRAQVEKKELHPAIIAATVHHRFTAIHPFEDGNGRMARLLGNLILMEAGFPPAIIRNERRSEYVFALREADQGNLASLSEMMLGELIHSEELLLKGAKGEAVEDLDDIDKQIALLKKEIKHLSEADGTKRSQETIRRFFEANLKPLSTALAQKLEQFDELFNSFRVSAYLEFAVIHSDGSSTMSAHGAQGRLAENIIPQLTPSFSKANQTPQELTINFQWRDFRKATSVSLELSSWLKVEFLSQQVALKTIGHSGTYNYDIQFSPEIIREHVDAICSRLIATVRNHAKKMSPKG